MMMRTTDAKGAWRITKGAHRFAVSDFAFAVDVPEAKLIRSNPVP